MIMDDVFPDLLSSQYGTFFLDIIYCAKYN